MEGEKPSEQSEEGRRKRKGMNRRRGRLKAQEKRKNEMTMMTMMGKKKSTMGQVENLSTS